MSLRRRWSARSIAFVLQRCLFAVAGKFAVLDGVLALGGVVVHRLNDAGLQLFEGECPVLLADGYFAKENLQLQKALGRDPCGLDPVASGVVSEISVMKNTPVRFRNIS